MSPPERSASSDNGSTRDSRRNRDDDTGTERPPRPDGLGHVLDDARLVARTELRRRRRTLGENDRMLVVWAFGALFGLVFVLVFLGGAYSLGTMVGTEGFADALPIARGIVLGVCGYVTFITAIRTVQERNALDAPAGILTATSPAAAAVGLLLADYAVVAGVAVLPLVVAGLLFAFGAGTPASVVVAPVVLLAALALAVVLGFVLGLVVRTLVSRFAIVARLKTVLSIALFVAYLAVLWSGGLNSVFGRAFGVVQRTPLGWVTDLALFGTPDPAIGIVRPAAAAVALVVAVPVLTWVVVRLDRGLWYNDPVQPSHGGGSILGGRSSTASNAPEGSSGGTAAPSSAPTDVLATGVSDRLFGGRVPRPTLRVAQKSWRRAYRAPMKLQYAVIPVFFLVTPIRRSIESGTVAPVLPAAVAIYGAWATGASFTLNPLGDEGAVLPVTLTTPVSGEQVLSGLMLAGLTAGAPVTALVATGLGILSPLGVVSSVAVGLLGVVLCVGACAVGAGVGAAYPKFERTRISRSRKAVVPSLSAFLVYSLSLLAVSLPGLVMGVPVVAAWAGDTVGAPPSVVTLGGLVVTVILAAAAGRVATRSAGETIAEYRF
jgi:ABC-2 type transport system permease protein